MVKIITADKSEHAAAIRALVWEYLQWAKARANEEFGVDFDIETMLEEGMQHLDVFMPPEGRLLLGFEGDRPAGIACLKVLAPGIGEIKRMYVRPDHRRRGLGRMLLSQVLREAEQIGYQRIRLDSARFTKEAHALYRTTGFNEIEAYEGSEIPQEFQEHWIFLEIDLREKQDAAAR